MKYLLPVLLSLMGCANQPSQLDSAQAQQLSNQAAAIAHRKPERAPPIYLIDNWVAFKHISCGSYMVGCAGLGTINAFYTYIDDAVFVNTSVLREPLNAVLIHELVHHLQAKQHDRRPCIDREQEAYEVQQVYSKIPIFILQRAEASCAF